MEAETEQLLREKPWSSVGAMKINKLKSRGYTNDEADEKAEIMSKQKIQALINRIANEESISSSWRMAET